MKARDVRRRTRCSTALVRDCMRLRSHDLSNPTFPNVFMTVVLVVNGLREPARCKLTMGDLTGGIDRCVAIDLDAVFSAIGDAAADDEVERRGAPHTIGQPHLGKGRQVEFRRFELGCAQLPLNCQLDRQFGLRF